MKILYIIPARGGSKGVPYKNIKLLKGKPLICYSIDVAKALTSDDNICVSTDDEHIIKVVENYGLKVPFVRPKYLSEDTSGSYDVILHALDFYNSIGKSYDTVVLLQPTSPLRNSNHVKDAIELYTPDIDMLVSVKETKSNPYYTLFEEDLNGFIYKSKELEISRRQDAPRVWELNGAIFIINVLSIYKNKSFSDFKHLTKYVMKEVYSIDIDTLDDWCLLEYYISKNIVKLNS